MKEAIAQEGAIAPSFCGDHAARRDPIEKGAKANSLYLAIQRSCDDD